MFHQSRLLIGPLATVFAVVSLAHVPVADGQPSAASGAGPYSPVSRREFAAARDGSTAVLRPQIAFDDVMPAVGPATDCNNNGIPDDADIAGGTSADCNTNGIPDECEAMGVLIEYENDAARWLAAVLDAESYAFDSFFPGIASGLGPLSDPTVEISLDSQVLTITDTSGGAAISDRSTPYGQVSDSPVESGAVSRWELSQPVYGLYTYYGSVGSGVTVTMSLYAGTTLEGSISRQGGSDIRLAYGHGFVSFVGIDRVEFEFSGPDNTVMVGAFVGLAPAEPSLGSITIPGYQGPDGETVQLDFAFTTVPPAQDCNTNGIPDECDITGGTSADCNNNGVPDECDPDADGDGVVDDCDACPDSDLSATIVIGGCDTGVANILLGDEGCSMADMIAACEDGASHHGGFVSCVVGLAVEWRQTGLITGRELGRIVRCAAHAGDRIRAPFEDTQRPGWTQSH